MQFTSWQIVALVAIVVIGSQLPMFALANSIDNDEAAKASLGTLAATVGSMTFVLVKLLVAKKPHDVEG